MKVIEFIVAGIVGIHPNKKAFVLYGGFRIARPLTNTC